ncbi:hypothetical protein K493DRAFT_313963 [Basidiobolus meristosporus CBS 931.73]|uniref:Uncharacterized protein n=1 Tax=Basidiobolus meristosporus CBS 931.73 TaxID=1314790 RepID=A0A1Y1YIC8_9FUNG|nr:hypothetical protein K493DRAFT_313963 [Basidiobolus meristosporus CBS 931.73]|eukprot:ORX97725.1 hypothetical protein K493DRAFT_313963 [Basidiobolus meristosporus CBS 931.73]
MMNPSLANDLNPDSYRSVLLGYCNGPICTKTQASSLASHIKSQCSEDLKKPALVTTLFLLENYEPFTEMSCAEDSFGGNCLLEYHDTYNTNPADFAYDELCTECSQSLFGIFNKWSDQYSTFFNRTYFNQLGDTCQFSYSKLIKATRNH